MNGLSACTASRATATKSRRSERKTVLDAIIGVKRPRGFHSLRATAAPRLEGLFRWALRNAHVVNDRHQDVLGVVAQFCLGHL